MALACRPPSPGCRLRSQLRARPVAGIEFDADWSQENLLWSTLRMVGEGTGRVEAGRKARSDIRAGG